MSYRIFLVSRALVSRTMFDLCLFAFVHVALAEIVLFYRLPVPTTFLFIE